MLSGDAAQFNELVFTQVINLDRSPDRLATIAQMLDAAEVAYTRFSAVDGRLLDLARDARVTTMFDLKKWRTLHHRNPIAADVGCYLSHFEAIKAFHAQERPLGLIFEDDASIEREFISTIMPGLIANRDWDILKLHARHPGPLVTRRQFANDTRLCSFVFKHSGATAYIVKHRAAAKMLKHMVPAVRMNDYVYDEGHRMNLRVRTIAPMPVSLQITKSTIEVDRKTDRDWLGKYTDRPLLPRWSLPLRRAADEIHRVFFNIFLDGGLAAMVSPTRKSDTHQ